MAIELDRARPRDLPRSGIRGEGPKEGGRLECLAILIMLRNEPRNNARRAKLRF